MEKSVGRVVTNCAVSRNARRREPEDVRAEEIEWKSHIYLNDMHRILRETARCRRRDRCSGDYAWPSIQRTYQLRKSQSGGAAKTRKSEPSCGCSSCRMYATHVLSTYRADMVAILQMMQVNHTCVKSDFAASPSFSSAMRLTEAERLLL